MKLLTIRYIREKRELNVNVTTQTEVSMNRSTRWVSIVVAMLMVGLSVASVHADVADRIREQLHKADARIPVKSITPTSMSSVYEVALESGEILYAHETGEFFIVGHLFQVDDQQGLINITEQTQNQMRVEALAAIPAADKITYPAKGQRKTTLHIYTDVDCPYCRQLHDEVAALNDMGVEVSYLAFPRGGPNTATYRTMVSIWCGEDARERVALMDRVKSGAKVPEKSCDNPVFDQLVLGQKMGVTGTPAMVLEDGSIIPGYMPAARIAQMLGIN